MHSIGTKNTDVLSNLSRVNDRYCYILFGSNTARIFIGLNVREDKNLATLADCILLRSNININYYKVSLHEQKTKWTAVTEKLESG